jgi:MFS family permease
LAWLVLPALVFLGWFVARERRLTRERRDPLVDVRLFRRPSYTAGVLLALTFFPAMAGLPLVLALFYQRGLGYSALQSALGITAYAAGSAVAAPLAGRVVVRIGRPLVVAAACTFGVGAIALAVVATQGPDSRVALAMAPALFVMGVGQGGLVTPNQTLTLMDVDPAVGSTAGGVLQTSQRIGLALGQAVIGAVFFAALDQASSPGNPYPTALAFAVGAALCFIALALVVSVLDLVAARRRRPPAGSPPEQPAPHPA